MSVLLNFRPGKPLRKVGAMLDEDLLVDHNMIISMIREKEVIRENPEVAEDKLAAKRWTYDIAPRIHLDEVSELWRLVTGAEPTDEELKRPNKQSIPEETRKNFWYQRGNTLDELITVMDVDHHWQTQKRNQVARGFEPRQNEPFRSDSRTRQNISDQNRGNAFLNRPKYDRNEGRLERGSNRSSPEKLSEQQEANLAEQVRKLKAKLKALTVRKEPAKCYKCNETGHAKSNCPKLAQESKKVAVVDSNPVDEPDDCDEESLGVLEGVFAEERACESHREVCFLETFSCDCCTRGPKLTVKWKSRETSVEIRALVDTRADITLIPESVVKGLKYTMYQRPKTFFGFNGQEVGKAVE